jgi:hypothetical protein
MTLSSPSVVMARLEEIDRDLAERQNRLEEAAMRWYRAKRDRERARAEAWLAAEGTVAERNAVADRETALMGASDEASYEALKSVVRVLDTRASIGQSLLKAQSRSGA